MNTCPCCGAEVKTDILLYTPLGKISRNGVIARISPQQCSIMELLVKRFPAPVNEAALLEQMYAKNNDEPEYADMVVRVHMSQLRHKLAPLGLGITSAYGIGWRLVKDEPERKDGSPVAVEGRGKRDKAVSVGKRNKKPAPQESSARG